MDKEIKYLLEEIKDNTYDYVGTNGCLYQDLSREELNLLLEYISNLQNQVQKYKEVIDKANKLIDKCIFPAYDEQSNDFQESLYKIKEVLKEVE